jgi:peptidoglycan/LPS O-acetylase OafA/YrhL
MSNESQTHSKVIGGIDSIRALAFIAVFLFHLDILSCGYLGVQAFFVLSGFLLTRILVDMKADLKGTKYFFCFYGRRALRIFPLYYIYLLIAGIAAYLFIKKFGETDYPALTRFWREYLYLATYTFNFFCASVHYRPSFYAGHLWSLAVEEQFYLIWPFIIYFVSKRKLKLVLLFIIILGPLVRLVEASASYYQIPSNLSANMNLVVYALPFSYFDAFAMGGFFSLFEVKTTKRHFWLLVFLVPMIGYLTQGVVSGTIEWRAFGYSNYMQDSFKYLWGYSLWSLLFCLLIQRVVQGDLFPLFFNNPILRYLGKISYGLYVFHLPVIEIMMRIGRRFPTKLVGLLALAITILISIASYELMEKRFLKLKERLVPKNVPPNKN